MNTCVGSPEVISSNVTYVLEGLNLNDLSTDKLKGLLPTRPIINELPELTIINYTEPPLQIVYHDRRIQINYGETSKEGLKQLARFSRTAFNALPGARLVAFGFNHEAKIKIEEASNVLTNLFIQSDLEIDNYHLLRIEPKLFYRNAENDSLYTINISVSNPTLLASHINVHFDTKELPPDDSLALALINSVGEFRGILGSLLGEQNE